MKKLSKILLVTGIYAPDIGGPASYVKALAKKLSTADTARVTVVTYSSVWSHPSDKEAKFRIIRIWKKWPWFLRHGLYAWRIFWEARQPRCFRDGKLFRKKWVCI